MKKEEKEETKAVEKAEKAKEDSKKLNDRYKTVVGEDGIEMLDEKPNKASKVSNQTLVIILLAFSTVLLAALIFVKRDAIFTSNIEVEENKEAPTEQTTFSNVPVEDTYAFATGEDFGIQFYVLHDGHLYYKIYDYGEVVKYQNYRAIDFNMSASYDIQKELTEYTALSGIKRIKTYNFSDSVSYSLILIMDDGSVYKLTYIMYTSQFNLTKLNVFGNYKVDNILDLNLSSECTSNNCASSYKIITNDGETITK